jgi:hypothetical protein
MLDRFLKIVFQAAGLMLIACAVALYAIPPLGPHLVRVADASFWGNLLPTLFGLWSLASLFLGLWMVVKGSVPVKTSVACSILLVAVIVVDALASQEHLRPGMWLAAGLMASIEFFVITGIAIHYDRKAVA